MQKYILYILIGIIIIISITIMWKFFSKIQNSSNTETTRVTEVAFSQNYLGSDYKGNYVWGGAMNLAWDDLGENILQEKPQLATDDEIALNMAHKLNNAPFTRDDLDKKSYYIKSGYGQETVDEINRESRKKFPSKSFEDLELQLSPIDIIAYAYFLKEVEYKIPFTKDTVEFNNQKVAGFVADDEDQKDIIEIIDYQNDDKFIIKLILKDKSDELILAKGYDMQSPEEVVTEISKNNEKYLPTIKYIDSFKAPKLHLDMRRVYNELTGKYFSNKNFKEYFISQMYENIKFDMNEKGARVENEAVIGPEGAAIMEPEEPKNFILDKPYWVVMKRTDSRNPYFILGVNNTELMENK